MNLLKEDEYVQKPTEEQGYELEPKQEVAQGQQEVEDPNVQDAQNVEVDEYGNPIDGQMPEEEAAYMQPQDEISVPPQTNENSNSADGQKTIHLFNLSKDLFDYTEVLEKALENIDNDFIATDVIVYLSQLEDTLARYKDKLRDFIAEVFYKETYEKNLYNYLTLRYELLLMIKYLRSLLRLDVIEDDEKDPMSKRKTQNISNQN